MLKARNRHQLALRSGLLLVLAATVATVVVGRRSGPGATMSSNPSAARADDGRNPAGNVTRAETVKVDALAIPRPALEEGGRDPFRFSAPTATSSLPAPALPDGRSEDSASIASALMPSPIETAVPMGPPPIPLRFIGFVDPRTQGGKIAVLTNGRSLFHGRENDVIDGKFRIVSIGVESMDLMFVDGRGVQTIKLSGQ